MAEFLELDDELDSLLGDFHPLISEADFDALLTLDLGITHQRHCNGNKRAGCQCTLALKSSAAL